MFLPSAAQKCGQNLWCNMRQLCNVRHVYELMCGGFVMHSIRYCTEQRHGWQDSWVLPGDHRLPESFHCNSCSNRTHPHPTPSFLNFPCKTYCCWKATGISTQEAILIAKLMPLWQVYCLWTAVVHDERLNLIYIQQIDEFDLFYSTPYNCCCICELTNCLL